MREGIQWLHERPATDLFSHDVLSRMDQVHQLGAHTCGPASGCPLIIMVQPTHDRKTDHLGACILSERNRLALFRDVLLDPLMGSCLVEVGDVGIEHALELPLLKDQQVVEAFLPHAPGEAFTDRIGSGSVIRSLEHFNATCRRHPHKTGSKLAIVITE